MAIDIKVEDVIKSALEAKLRVLHVACPGSISSYDENKNVADVLPMVKRPMRDEDGDIAYEVLQTVPAVPVIWQGTSAFMIKAKLVKGDTGLLMFADIPWGEWLDTGNVGEPTDQRRHSIGYPGFFPGLRSNANPIAAPTPISGASMTIGDHSGGPAVIGFDGSNIQLGANGDFLALKKTIDDLASAIGEGFTAVGAGASANGPAGKTAFDALYTAILFSTVAKAK